MTASCHKLYLGKGISVTEWGGQRMPEYFKVVPFQMTHLSCTSHLFENSCYGEPLGDSCVGVTGTDWDSSRSNSGSSSSRCVGIEQRLRTNT